MTEKTENTDADFRLGLVSLLARLASYTSEIMRADHAARLSPRGSELAAQHKAKSTRALGDAERELAAWLRAQPEDVRARLLDDGAP